MSNQLVKNSCSEDRHAQALREAPFYRRVLGYCKSGCCGEWYQKRILPRTEMSELDAISLQRRVMYFTSSIFKGVRGNLKWIDRRWLVFYISLLIPLFMGLQALFGIHFQYLHDLQQSDIYKQVSGFAVLFVIILQWRLNHVKQQGITGEVLRRCYLLHKNIGAVIPIVFFVHSSVFGYGYQILLVLALLGSCIFGHLHSVIMRRGPIYHIIWLTSHVTLSSLVIVLAGYHVYITYVYS